MSKPSRRLNRQKLNEKKKELRLAAKKLKQFRAEEGLESKTERNISNGTSALKTVEEEKEARQEAVEEKLKIYRSALPTLLKRLNKIKDPRNPKTIRHKLTVLMLHGILAFAYHMASRREANREMTMPMFRENLRLMFPELESVPHQDTLNRLLSRIDVDKIEDALLELIQRLIRNKKFHRYLLFNSYYGENYRKKQTVHVVICEESWNKADRESAQIVPKSSKHAWLSSEPLIRQNVHERCNLGARHRWGIESNFLIEKHPGYEYEHCFSYNWTAMKGYHFLMRLGHLINILAQNTELLAKLALQRGLRGLIRFIRDTCAGPWLDAKRIRQIIESPCQIRLL